MKRYNDSIGDIGNGPQIFMDVSSTGAWCYYDDVAEVLATHANELAARDAELAALRGQVEDQRRQIDALKASRKAYMTRNHYPVGDNESVKACIDADAACRAAGVELEDRT